MDASLDKQFQDLQRAMDTLRAGVEAREAKLSQIALERRERKLEQIPQADPRRPFRLSSFTTPNHSLTGPWTVTWVETDGVTIRPYEREFVNKGDAWEHFFALRRRRDGERDRA